ncbi:MAG: periplasmic heavy metal sensor [Sorangiineae bacterium]|nr:periplasmic heavy metal sensor [Polyangiaceae bacterium]MEB2325105.1 periplasmic heavy metal sensor [Sorangiineae bacterium]
MLLKNVLAGGALLAALAASAPALARPPPGGSPAGKRAQVEERMREVRKRILRDRVGLDEKKALAVEKVLDKNVAAERAARQEERKHRKEIERLLASDSNDQAAYAKALAGLRASEKRLAAMRQNELDEVAKLLTPKEQAKFVTALRKTGQRLGRALGRYRQEHGGPEK